MRIQTYFVDQILNLVFFKVEGQHVVLKMGKFSKDDFIKALDLFIWILTVVGRKVFILLQILLNVMSDCSFPEFNVLPDLMVLHEFEQISFTLLTALGSSIEVKCGT